MSCRKTTREEAPLQDERKPVSPTTWEEPLVPQHGLSGTLRPTLQCKRYTEFLLQFERSFVSSATTRVEPRVSRCTSRGMPNSLLQLKRRPNSPAATQEEPWITPHNLRGGLTRLLQLERKLNIPIATIKEHRVSHHNPRRTWSSPRQLKTSAKPSGETPEVSQEEPTPPQFKGCTLLQPERKPHATTKRRPPSYN